MSKEFKTFDSDRVFKVKKPVMNGNDVRMWQSEIKKQFKKLNIDCPIVCDGYYGVSTRSFTADLCHSLGMTAHKVMADGVTPHLRWHIVNNEFTASQKKYKAKRTEYRKKLRARYKRISARVHAPVSKILQDSWGFHPPVHDGIDIITEPDATLYAMIKAKVIDVRSSGWWGKGAPSPAIAAKGDGIIQLEVLETIGPFKKGHHIGYGHAEKAKVKVGQIVEAGDKIGHAGLANAWHIHFMYNGGADNRGIGTIDPRAILDYSVKHG